MEINGKRVRYVKVMPSLLSLLAILKTVLQENDISSNTLMRDIFI